MSPSKMAYYCSSDRRCKPVVYRGYRRRLRGFFLLSGLQAAVAPDVTGIAGRDLVLARIPNEVGESPSKAFDHPVIPEPSQNKVLAGTALSVLL